MEKKINVAELLKDCPKGMELDCTMYDRVTFDEVTTVIGFDDKKRVKIILSTHYSDGTKDEINLTEYGTYTYDGTAKCVIFPKGKTTWEGFVPPCKFKDGDIVATQGGEWLGITKNETSCGIFNMHCAVNCIYHNEFHTRGEYCFSRFATEEEKEKLFVAIKDNGYKWNAETKTLEKMIKDKFDINTLVPFESRVLVRDSKVGRWKPAYWGFYDKTNNVNYPYVIVGGSVFGMSIPYENNEHLLGTTDDCDEFYKTW